MALVKNTTGTDTAMTIRHFRRNTDIKAWIDDQNIYSSIIAKYYLALNNKAIGNMTGAQPDIFSFHKGDTIVIKAEFAGGGPFFGAYISPSDNNLILLEDDEIKWVINSTTVASVPYTEGIHTYGWIGVDDNGTRKSQPYYDGDVVSGSSPQEFDDRTIVYIGGVNMGQGVSPACVTGSDNAIRIYEVVASTSEGRWHLYPCTCVLNGTTYHTMFDSENRTPKRVKATLVGNSSGTHEATGDFPQLPDGTYVDGFGIQLDDLKRVTGSPFIDLLPIMTDDGGADTAAGFVETSVLPNSAAAPYELTKTADSSKLPFAVWLGGSSQTGRIIPPTGYTQPSGTDEIGVLLEGRTPKWSIWNDTIAFGFYILHDTQRGIYELRFNAFKRIGSNQNLVNIGAALGQFDNYNTAASAIHPPRMTFSDGNLVCHIHNGAFARCLHNDLLAGRLPNDAAYFRDDQCVFLLNTAVGGVANYRPGNLLPWAYTAEELSNYGYAVYGVRFYVSYNGSEVPYFSDDDYKNLNYPLCKDALTAHSDVANILRNTGKSLSLTINENNKWSLLADLMAAQNHQIEMVGHLDFTLGSDHAHHLNVDRLFPNASPFHIQALIDPQVNLNPSTTKYRMVVDKSQITESESASPWKLAVLGRMVMVGSAFNPQPLETKYVSSNYSCIFLPIIRSTKHTYNSAEYVVPIYDKQYTNPDGVTINTPTSGTDAVPAAWVASNNIGYKAFVEVYRTYTNNNNTEQYHYVTMVNAFNNMIELKRYCMFGSPTALSKVSQNWAEQSGLLAQCWGENNGQGDNYSDVWPDQAEARHSKYGWWGNKSDMFPFAASGAPNINEYHGVSQAAKTIVVPRRLLWNEGGASEMGNDITSIVHILPTDTNKAYSSFGGRGCRFNTPTYQKIVEYHDEYSTVYMAFATPYQEYTKNASGQMIGDIDSGSQITGMKWWFRAYQSNGSGYDWVQSFLAEVDTIYVRLTKKNGTQNWANLADGAQGVERGTEVAVFTLHYSSSSHSVSQTVNRYTLQLADNAAPTNRFDFHKWSTEADNAAFNKFTLTAGNNVLEAGAIYELEISPDPFN